MGKKKKKKLKYIIEQKNKYLDDLGMKRHEYGVNFIQKSNGRKKLWDEQKKTYGFDVRETWALSDIFVEWLYSHLKMYLSAASEIVNLDYHKVVFEEKEYTQREAIEFIIRACESYLTCEDDFTKEYEIALKEMQKAIQMWAIILPYMWW